MNKAELVSAVAAKTGLSRKDCEKVINTSLDVITETLADGGRVQLVGFGAFEVKERAAHIGRNPHTKEAMEISASRAAGFKAGKALKDAVAR